MSTDDYAEQFLIWLVESCEYWKNMGHDVNIRRPNTNQRDNCIDDGNHPIPYHNIVCIDGHANIGYLERITEYRLCTLFQYSCYIWQIRRRALDMNVLLSVDAKGHRLWTHNGEQLEKHEDETTEFYFIHDELGSDQDTVALQEHYDWIPINNQYNNFLRLYVNGGFIKYTKYR